jgi:putative transcriptional regulator
MRAGVLLTWLLLLPVLLPAPTGGAQDPTGDPTRDAAKDTVKDPASLAGQLLIATPTMGDPRFAQTVILMARHDREGAFGIVINRPLGERSLAQLLEALGKKSDNQPAPDDPASQRRVRIFAGGPVQPELGFVLHSAEFRLPETQTIDAHIALTASREILRALARPPGEGPRHSLIAFGYAGWGPGQLEGELASRAWFTAPADSRLVFEEPREKVWEIAVSRRTQDL